MLVGPAPARPGRLGLERCGDGWTGWCLAEQGEVRRHYDSDEPDGQVGARHPAEADRQLPHESGPGDECDAETVAGRASVDPSALGPHTRVTGHGTLALTRCGRRHGHPPGALLI